jgi:sugar phosphate isomerase/epimerase
MSAGLKASKISISSRAIVDDPFNWAYELEDMGFSGWEIVCEGQQSLNSRNLEKINNILETTNLILTIHLPFSDLNLASLNEPVWNETLRQMKECIRLASSFSQIAVVHPGHLSPLGMQMPDLAWQKNIEGLQQLCDFAVEYDVVIAVENMVNLKFIFGRHAEEMLGMIESVNRENVGLTFDVGHANTNGMVNSFLDKCLDKVVHVHLHDNHAKKDDHLPAGCGTVDWPKVISAISGLEVRFVCEARTMAEGGVSLRYIEDI